MQEVTSRFTCSTEVMQDFAEQCDQRIDDLTFDLSCTRLALDIWTPVAATAPMTGGPIVEERIADLADRDLHEHLEPIEEYAEIVFRQLFMDSSEEPDLLPAQ